MTMLCGHERSVSYGFSRTELSKYDDDYLCVHTCASRILYTRFWSVALD